MGNRARKLTRAQEKARRRTQQGFCARCGRGVKLHVDGNCPDGGGTFTWAMTREDMAGAIANLDRAQEQANRVHLTAEEQRVLDVIASRAMRGQESKPSDLVTLCDLPLHTARAVC